jgi:hypothetical protein
MRNAFEHFDSRLDEFLASPDSPDTFWVVDHNVGDADVAALALPDGTDRPMKALQNFDPKSGIASVLDDKINLQELADAVFKLDEASRLWLKTKQEPLETQASQPSIAGPSPHS